MEYASKIFFIFLVSIIAMGHASLQEPLDANGVLESLKNQYYPNVAISYYEIAGSTLEDLSNPMRILGPVGDDGLRHIAQVHGKVYADWSRYYDADGSCRVDNVDVSCDCEVVFPRWRPPKDASPKLIAKWENLSFAIAEHEKGHVDIIQKNCQSAKGAIMVASCDWANSAADDANYLIQQQNNEYDAVTNHGATQGVTFGPTNKNFVNPDKQDSLDAALLQGKSRKTVAERFAELNKIKKNATK